MRIKWSKELITERLRERIDKGEPYTHSAIKKSDPKLWRAIERHFGKLSEALRTLDMEPQGIQKVYTPEYILARLESKYRASEAMNPSLMWSQSKSFMRAVEREFGSYRNALSKLGIPYETILASDQTRTQLGYEFEEAVAKLFDNLGIEYTKEPYIPQELHPDFRLDNDRVWWEVKLTEGTLHSSVIKKYEPHCEILNVVYLVGKEGSRKYAGKDNVNVLNINEMIQGDLEFQKTFNDLRDKLKETERVS